MKRELKFNLGKLIINDSIVYLKINKNQTIGLYESKYLYDFLRNNIDGLYYYIIKIGGNTNFTEESMIFYSDGIGRIADAIVVNDYVQSLNIEYYYNKSKIPVKIFRNTKRANEWIKKLKSSIK
jgi:hypothetical protein